MHSMELGLVDSVLVSPFNLADIEQVKRADSGIATAALVAKAVPDPAVLLRRLNVEAYNPKVGEIRPAETP